MEQVSLRFVPFALCLFSGERPIISVGLPLFWLLPGLITWLEGHVQDL